MTKLTSRNPSLEGMSQIQNKTFGEERALYASKDLFLNNVKFEGKEDGESALKESNNIVIDSCKFDLRYPLWHVNHAQILNSKFTKKSRAPLWYDKDIEIQNTTFEGVKVFRECKSLNILDSKIISEEPFWRCNDVTLNKTTLEGFYAFFECKDVNLSGIKFSGKYSFQYNKNLYIINSTLDTKDAFWHSSHVVVRNSTIKGEYLAWYSSDLTFINCVIESHQPFCYSKNIRLINCKMPNSDLAFEYSSVHGNITGHIDSIKNPRSGKLKVDSLGELVLTGSKIKSKAKIIVNKK